MIKNTTHDSLKNKTRPRNLPCSLVLYVLSADSLGDTRSVVYLEAT